MCLLLAVACESGTTESNGATTDAGDDTVVPVDSADGTEVDTVGGSDVEPVDDGVLLDDGESPDAADATPDTPDAPHKKDTGDDPDTGTPEVCCAKNGDCEPSEFCAPVTKVGLQKTGHCLPLKPTNGDCWYDTDCGFGETCSGAQFPKCGNGEAVAGICIPQQGECCVEGWSCPSGESCYENWCVAGDWDKGACFTDVDCSFLGWVCGGSTQASGSCDDTTATPPGFGVCEPFGPGGMCLAVTPLLFGECPEVLGWAWTGSACQEVTGCDCGDHCDAVYGTEEDCKIACLPPICCEGPEACAPGLLCHLGHCVVPAAEGECFGVTDCAEGLLCVGASTCSCGSTWCGVFLPFAKIPPPKCDDPPCDDSVQGTVGPGKCIEPPVCCASNDACDGDEVCVAVPWAEGRCEPQPESGSCWSATDCNDGEYCASPQPCPCNYLECVPMAGTCKPLLDNCCTSSESCAEGEVCTALVPGEVPGMVPGAEVGVCLPAPAEGTCFTPAQCDDDQTCQYFSGFACQVVDFSPSPGSCSAKDGQCCGTDPECADGYVCAQPAPSSGKVCKAVPLAGECWNATQCEEGEACVGAEACGGCSAVCQNGGAPGTCQSGDGLCCTTDADCEGGLWCSATLLQKPYLMPGSTLGQCVEPPNGGTGCFTHSQCGPGQVCAGFSGLPCGVDPSGGKPWYAGYCSNAEGACCDDPLDCAEGYSCVAGEGGGQAACKPTPVDGLSCWTAKDCNEGQVCDGGFVCGCGWCDGKVDALGTCADE